MLGVAIGTMALVIVLSVFNGFESLVKSFYSTLDSDLRITIKEGKLFDPSTFNVSLIKKHDAVLFYNETIEEMAMLKYENRQYPGAIVKGVSENFNQLTAIDSLIVDGSFTLENNDFDYAVVGLGVAHFLGIRALLEKPISIYVPKKDRKIVLNLSQSLNQKSILPAGIFSVIEDVDSKYIFVPFRFARELFETENKITAIELKLKTGSDSKKLQKTIQDIVGDNFSVKNRYQQHDTLYKTMKSEKWATYFILIFVLLIASFNILGSLTMLIIDKKDDISILRSMGAGNSMIRTIFIAEGWLISITGSITGLIAGVFICMLQIWFDLVKLPGTGSFVISAYPVEIQIFDVLLVLFIVIGIGFLAAWYPVRFISGRFFSEYS